MRRTRFIAAVLLIAYASACTSYHTLAGGVDALQQSPKPPQEVRLTLKTGERLRIRNPEVYGDSLRGMSPTGPAVTVALGDIQQIETRRTSASKTIALVLGVGMVIGSVAAVVALSSSNIGSCSLDGSSYDGSW